MATSRYGMSGTAGNILKRYMENACIVDYHKVKSAIEQQIGVLSTGGPSHFCNKCGAIKDNIIAQNEKFNSCYRRNSKLLKLIDDEGIKGFIEDCSDYPKCVLNRKRFPKKPVTSEKATAGKDKQQSRGYSKTSKPGGSTIKGPPGQDQSPIGGKALTKAKPIPHHPNGINASHNAGEAQKGASKQIANLPASTSGRTETQAQKISQSVHSQVTETDSHPSASMHGTSDGEDHLLKPTKLIDLRISTSESGSSSSQIAEDYGVKNQDLGDGASVTEITKIGDPATKGVGTDICSNTPDGKESCDKIAVIRDPAIIVPSVDVSIGLDFNLDEYPCSEDDILELFGSETVRGEARGREASSIKVTGNEENGAVLNAVMLNTSTDKDTEVAVLTHSHKFHVTEGVSDLNMCQPTSDMVSTPRCVPSNRAAESAFCSHKQTCSEQHNNQDQASSRQDSRQVDQLNQGNFAQEEGKLHCEVKSSLQVENCSGGATTLQAEEDLDDPNITDKGDDNLGNYIDHNPTNIIDLIEKYKKYNISALLPLVIFLLLFLLIKVR
ncbi:hypothetical protein PVMG_06078 [Plasmodium vivax Mauritania I]|uniref:Variable surface protein Vir18 n=1 Tax=Plasmodium vivax Mauritania I TaxID=1035515 RepID=A0A0J9T8Y8_PLAVI|nr:hypothetical protein PVMG_06078 [Plasmodium vivax Mauritania I]